MGNNSDDDDKPPVPSIPPPPIQQRLDLNCNNVEIITLGLEELEYFPACTYKVEVSYQVS